MCSQTFFAKQLSSFKNFAKPFVIFLYDVMIHYRDVVIRRCLRTPQSARITQHAVCILCSDRRNCFEMFEKTRTCTMESKVSI